MSLVLLIGGARAGKSSLAVELAANWSGDVTFVATAEARDDEMARRIAQHRSSRPEKWTTVEEPFDLRTAIEALEDSQFAILDCLTLWVANLLERGDGVDEVLAQARQVAAVAGERSSPLVTVTNEVGLGVVPATELGRAYRDVMGAVNRVFADRAERTYLIVAGRALPLVRAQELS